jgi:hypothetical protein
MEMDLTLLLPQAQTIIKFDKFLTQLPTFKQTWASLPRVFFGHLRIVGSGSPITVGVGLPVMAWTTWNSYFSPVCFRDISQGSDLQC